MSPTPELSVVIVTYRCRDLVLDCLADLDVVRSRIDIEVLVVDNASDDGTTEAIAMRHPWVLVEGLAGNIGFGRANNRAIRRCRAESILLLNPDTRIDPEAIRALLGALLEDPAVGIVGPTIVDERGRLDFNCRRGFPTVLGIVGCVTGLDRRIGWRPLGAYRLAWLTTNIPTDVVSLSGAVMMARRSTLEALEGFDERFFMYGEDIDLCIRTSAAGWRVRYVPDATVVHLGGGSPASGSTRRAWARAIGDVHRIHRPGLRGRLAGAVCDLGGVVLSRLSSTHFRARTPARTGIGA